MAAQCSKRKKKRKDKEGLFVATATTITEFPDKFEKEFSLVTLVSSVGSVGFVRDGRWNIDS
jgi:hypothetical protein